MKHAAFYSLLLFISVACKQIEYVENPYAQYTPNGIAVNDTLICDQTEVSNFNWMEYRFWLKKTFGEDSPQYLSSAADTTIWDSLTCQKALKDYYGSHPAYKSYPVVGITQQQARDFSQWRSDRVFENYLIREGVIKPNPKQNASNYFSVERYFRGTYFDIAADTLPLNADIYRIRPDMNQRYPQFGLPDDSMRVAILNYVDVSDYLFHQKKAKKYQKWRETHLPFMLAIDGCETEPMRPDTYEDLDKRSRFLMIYDSRGNAAEWGETENLTYGGGWPHNVEYIMSKDTVSSVGANAWTGFRNVCVWKTWNP